MTKGKKHNDDEIIGIVIGILATLILLLFILMIAIIIRQKRGKLYNNHRPVKVSTGCTLRSVIQKSEDKLSLLSIGMIVIKSVAGGGAS